MRNSICFALAATCVLASGWLSGARAAEPTFDCSKAEHEIEVLICGSDDLAAKDRKLAEVYGAALERAKGFGDAETAISDMKAYQRGWIGGRNECWKADDKTACTADAYDRRIAELQARYMLIEAGPAVFYRCNDNSEIAATFFVTDLPSVRLERGDSVEIGVLVPAGSGSKYEASFGVYFWTKGEEATAEWPQGTELTCTKQG